MNIMKPKFSVIIATYNRKQQLKIALNSLLNQDENNWEAWIIDDGSTDKTYELIENYQKIDQRINYFRQKNKGAIHAKNKGIQLSNAEFITFLDSDDYYLNNHLSLRKNYLNENPKVDFLHGGAIIIGNQYVPDRNQTDQMIHLSKCIIGGTFFIKNKILKQLGGFNELPIGTDAELYERAIKANIIIHKISDETYVYNRIDNNSITHNFNKKINQSS